MTTARYILRDRAEGRVRERERASLVYQIIDWLLRRRE